MRHKNYKAIAGFMIGTLLTAGTIAACSSQSAAAPTQAITSSHELMASGAKTASVPVETTSQALADNAVSPAAKADGEGITLEEAKKIALAQVPGADDSHIRIETDRDDGQLLYEGKIVYNGLEYEFEISAADGTVLDWEIDD